MFSKEELQQLRADTPGTAQRIHLNNAGAALMPLPVLDAMRQHLELEAAIGGYEAAALRQEAFAEFYQQLALLLHTNPTQIAYCHQATQAFNAALSSIPFQRGDVVLTTLDDYVSNQIAFMQLQHRFGVQIQHAANMPDGGIDLEDFEKKLRQHSPKLVAVTHIPTNSGLIQPVEAIGALCKNKDGWYLVDACQSAGQVPIDVQAIGCDFLSASMRKFLRGPRGAGFLYVSDRVIKEGLEPLYMDLHSASWASNTSYTGRADARRFELWERSYASHMGSAAAVQYALKIGLERLSTRLCQLATELRTQLAPLNGVTVLDKGPQLGGIVTIHVKGWKPLDLHGALQQKNINTSVVYHESARFDFDEKGVDWALRISPHYYNLEEEIDALIKIITQLLYP